MANAIEAGRKALSSFQGIFLPTTRSPCGSCFDWRIPTTTLAKGDHHGVTLLAPAPRP